MAYDLLRRNCGPLPIDPGLGSEVGTKEVVDVTPAEARLVEAHAKGRSWYVARKDTRVLANLEGMTVLRGGVRMVAPWPPAASSLENQPLVRAGSPLASPMQVAEGSCNRWGVAKRAGDWGLTETCVLPTGNAEVLEDFAWLRAQGFVPVAAIDQTGGFVMGYAWAGDLARTAPPPFARDFGRAVPMPSITRPGRRIPRVVLPPGVYLPGMLQPPVAPPVAPPIVTVPDVDVSEVKKSDSLLGWLAFGGVVLGGLYLGAQAAKKSKRPEARAENRRRRNTKAKRKNGWHWLDEHTAVKISRGVPAEVSVFARSAEGLDLAMAKVTGWWGRTLRDTSSRKSSRTGALTIQAVKVKEA